LGAIDEAHGDPALRRRERTALADLDEVVRAELLGLVVGVVALAALDVLAVDRVAKAADHLDRHGLLGATRARGIADHPADEVALVAALLDALRGRPLLGSLRGVGHLAHPFSPAALFAR